MSAPASTSAEKTPVRKRRARRYPSRTAPPTGSRVATKTAAVILEVLSGVRDTGEASQALGVALSRYYVLEARAIQGLVTALEPRPKGKQQSPEAALRQSRQEVARLAREVARTQALLRVSQRTLGVKPVRAPEKRSKLGTSSSKSKVRRRRRTVRRAAQAIARLRSTASGDAPRETPREAERCQPDVPPPG
ncbi:MAG: hypothetical protein ACYS5V_12570 [Planctomycetota bacterium]|jgi:hypothetical protein